MSERLKEVFERAFALPEEEQERIAARWVAELDEEAKWDASFASSQDLLGKMAADVRAQRRAGLTRPIEELCD